MLDSILTFFFGSKRDRDVKQLLPVVEKINQKEIKKCKNEADRLISNRE